MYYNTAYLSNSRFSPEVIQIFRMESINNELKRGFLFGNKYIIRIVPVGVKTRNIFDSNIGMLINTVALPTVNFNTKQIPSTQTHATISADFGQLDLTVYNTGQEYDSFHNWGAAIYNQQTRAYAYPNDTVVDINVSEYDKANNQVLMHEFNYCNLISYGGLQLSHNESVEVQTFSASVNYRQYKLLYTRKLEA